MTEYGEVTVWIGDDCCEGDGSVTVLSDGEHVTLSLANRLGDATVRLTWEQWWKLTGEWPS